MYTCMIIYMILYIYMIICIYIYDYIYIHMIIYIWIPVEITRIPCRFPSMFHWKKSNHLKQTDRLYDTFVLQTNWDFIGSHLLARQQCLS
jgi:hypothetical protein